MLPNIANVRLTGVYSVGDERLARRIGDTNTERYISTSTGAHCHSKYDTVVNHCEMTVLMLSPKSKLLKGQNLEKNAILAFLASCSNFLYALNSTARGPTVACYNAVFKPNAILA